MDDRQKTPDPRETYEGSGRDGGRRRSAEDELAARPRDGSDVRPRTDGDAPRGNANASADEEAGYANSDEAKDDRRAQDEP